ncbi:hypothetical protein SNOG_11297 [Parastagonospora nodorum SN15]|uniref:Uncharacterized protein n=1 Tax=Phaeosphaeria nodorum (strain SN15 / ATCC MYA-4574 / FGSC 10173) TaxID=321614 RepID=Q0UAB7_PHANO|nr:hypothetical protein SNOG_11297 [Parastagonospora nodorum SN15]EAT81005.1 hypothetical protein SNOG_11297 [Parastagonospora nodorum SN15]
MSDGRCALSSRGTPAWIGLRPQLDQRHAGLR